MQSNFWSCPRNLDQHKKKLGPVKGQGTSLTWSKLKTYFEPILEEQGIKVSINLKKIFTSAHPIHYSPNRNILSKNYDAFFSH